MGKHAKQSKTAFKGLGQFQLLESDEYYKKPRKPVTQAVRRFDVVRSITAPVPGIKWRLV